jgi:hypothetical protein
MINVGKDKDKYICHDCGLECESYEPIEDEAPEEVFNSEQDRKDEEYVAMYGGEEPEVEESIRKAYYDGIAEQLLSNIKKE